ncbi:Nucleotide-binding universal stress protein, UspA family [Propionibacterium cyclohexanicum]|uniref:Nucleotide-binding universal stress protein, UspA family n=1 Tax=Propionibacterium cyclohexanicum TaxID=64702 RepID=A0A1H9RIF9_9ACTN|nr:universal stress protein [Propionibacterium cyclohexanicum]SER72611.1 Nucleotide-binding universal stress protein, UspA family [Propionibacterium cyclohexanicum]
MTYKRILVGVDGSEQATRAFHAACELAASQSASVHVVQVIDRDRLVRSPYGGGEEFYEHQVNRARENVAACLAEGRRLGIDVQGETISGSASLLLGRELPKEYEIDLIVLGSTGLSAVERLLLGSRSNYVLRNAPCDVLIVR